MKIRLSGARSWTVLEAMFSTNQEVVALLAELKRAYGGDWSGMSPWVWKAALDGETP